MATYSVCDKDHKFTKKDAAKQFSKYILDHCNELIKACTAADGEFFYLDMEPTSDVEIIKQHRGMRIH